MKRLNFSVGRKISLIIFLFLASTGLLVGVSFVFFGKISQIASINNVCSEYEVLFCTSKYEFEKFKLTGENFHYDAMLAALESMNRKDGAVPIMYKAIKNGLTMQQALQDYQKRLNVDPDTPGQAEAANLVKTMMGRPELSHMVQVSGQAHDMSSQWIQLVSAYKDDAAQRGKILRQIQSMEAKVPVMLKEYKASVAGIAEYLMGIIKRIFLIFTSIMGILVIVIAFFITRSITKPLGLTVSHVRQIADGNFLNTLEIRNKDELGMVVEAMNEMSGQLRDMVRDIKADSDALNRSAGDLSQISDNVAENASANAKDSAMVSESTQEMSRNMSQVSEAMASSSQNTASVVSAVEEMTATINEIARNTESAKLIADNAVAKSNTARDQMETLNDMALSINQVTEAIRDISEQTDLLSLNATIEAARAGEAGKGFAVVANEIKELSKQTSAATQDIKGQIEKIQMTTSDSLGGIQDIASIVTEVNQIVHTIASAVEEQSIVTAEIAKNAADVSLSIEGVNEKVAENARVSSDVTAAIDQVSQSSTQMNRSSSRMKESSKQLSSIAEDLRRRIQRFQI